MAVDDKTIIINRALTLLGTKRITNLDTDDTPSSRTALSIYDTSLESVLSECLWGFATKRVLLAQLSDTVAFSNERETLSFVYQVPGDVVRIFETNDTAAYWRQESDKIVSDTSGLGIKYVFLQTNTNLYYPKFVEAFSHKLAADMAYPLLNSKSKTDDMNDLYHRIYLPKAKSENSQVGTAKEVNDDYYLFARFGGPNIQEFS